jgi:hypothetical protein
VFLAAAPLCSDLEWLAERRAGLPKPDVMILSLMAHPVRLFSSSVLKTVATLDRRAAD